MLSRIAESLFWIGRYVERAEDTARILDVHIHHLLEAAWRRDRNLPGAARRHGRAPFGRPAEICASADGPAVTATAPTAGW